MVITVLEAHVPSENWSTLEQTYQDAIKQLDAGIVRTLLLHNFTDPTLWRIETIWQTREALDAMRRSGETPRGVLIFRAAGAEPILSIFDVTAQAQTTSASLDQEK